MPQSTIRVREPVQMPDINFKFFFNPYLLALLKSKILFGPGDQTVRAAVRVISKKTEIGIRCSFLILSIISIRNVSKKIYPKRILVVDFGELSTYCDSGNRHSLKKLSTCENFATLFDRNRGREGGKCEGEILWIEEKNITIF